MPPNFTKRIATSTVTPHQRILLSDRERAKKNFEKRVGGSELMDRRAEEGELQAQRTPPP